MKTLAIIPARGGSKGVPGKNKAIVNGKPLIAYTIETALESKTLDYLVVSTDDQDILKIAAEYEGVLLHDRAKELASDTSPITDTIRKLAGMYVSDVIMLLQPTSPIREVAQIEKVVQLLADNKTANSVISVTAMDDVHPARMYWNKEGLLNPILEQFEQTRRQDIPKALYRNGAIYAVRSAAFHVSGEIMAKPSIGLEMPSSQLLNIDEPRDLLLAEVLIKAWKNNEL